jgi:hypothetical protein
MSELINYDRTWRYVVCLNPEHETVKFETNDIGDILCPTCKELMVVEIKPKVVIVYETDSK